MECVGSSFPLLCYIQNNRQAVLDFTLEESKRVNKMTYKRYKLISQKWSPGGHITPAKWVHDVEIVIPEYPKAESALLFISGGENNVETGTPQLSKDLTTNSLEEIVRNTGTIGIRLHFAPNQPLRFQPDNAPLVEDYAVARSWNLFLNDPVNLKQIPLHIPCVDTPGNARIIFGLLEREIGYGHVSGLC
ncbi:PhoPQ-activated protein PqaA family protein [Ochrobactrum sp. GPK 3]|uniref:PhoPQ-activated protein PqaA family protein n=1 Tax=Brucella sp. 22210 TaxID=3453892 RepID=UPI0031384B56